MKKYLLILCLVLSIFSQKEIELKFTNSNPITIKNEFNLKDQEEGFYEEIITKVSPNGTFFVYDIGNKVCHKFDRSGKLVKSFGKAGNGPGEFSEMILDFEVSDERIVFKNAVLRTVMIYDTDGNFIKDIKGNLLIGSQIVINKNIEFHFPKNELSKLARLVVDKDGNEIEKVENKNLEVGALEDMQKNFSKEHLKKNLQRPLSFYPYNGGFVQHYSGEYRIDFVNKDYSMGNRLTYKYNRVKIGDLIELAARFEKRVIKKLPEANRKRVFMLLEKVKTEKNGFHDDIIGIVGTYKNFLFVQTRAENDKMLKLHVISDSNKIVQKIELECEEITSVKVANGYLIINQINDEEGPYSTIYSIFI